MEFFATYFLVGGLICAGVGGYIAGEKNRNSGEWAIICFFLGIFGIIAVASVSSLPTLEEELKKEFPQAKIYVSKPQWDVSECALISDTSFLVVDFEQKKIVIGIREARKKPPEQPYQMSFAFFDIVRAEIVRDGNQVVTTNLFVTIGRGSVTGGLSNAKKALIGAQRIVIRITVENTDKTVHEVTFYASTKEQGGLQGEELFDHAVEKSLEFAGYLDTAIKEARSEESENNTEVSEQISRQEVEKEREKRPENNQVLDVSEKIAKLWQLKQEGALTQEEFEEQKTKLLQS